MLARSPRSLSSLPRLVRPLAIGAAALVLSACVMVPVNPDGSLYAGPVIAGAAPAMPAAALPAAPPAVTLPVRLYPTNEVAAAGGVVSGSVVSALNGKGSFTLVAQGETMTGEATRLTGAGGNPRSGVANAYGARGGFAQCQYTMNSSTQGTGRCAFSTGATYQLHIGP